MVGAAVGGNLGLYAGEILGIRVARSALEQYTLTEVGGTGVEEGIKSQIELAYKCGGAVGGAVGRAAGGIWLMDKHK